jgi:hypothetical protein
MTKAVPCNDQLTCRSVEVSVGYIGLQWRTIPGKCVMYGTKGSHGVSYDATFQLLHVMDV